MRIALVVNDDCLQPEIVKQSDQITVQMGLNHDFDDILDICAGELAPAQLALLHRLWSDDEFPRTFRREGGKLIITERDAQ